MEPQHKIQANRLLHLKQMVGLFNFQNPLDQFLREYFQLHKNFGSRDRRFYRNIIYNFFRLHHLQLPEDLHYHLSAQISGDLDFAHYMQTLTKHEFTEGGSLLYYIQSVSKNALDLYPCSEDISTEINMDEWATYFFNKTKVWCRVEKGNINNIVQYLNKYQIPFTNEKGNIFGFETNVDIKDIASKTHATIVVQDLSSQLATADVVLKNDSKFWDCCAASGGKTLMLYHRYPEVNFYASDVRSSIIDNLKKRFQISGLKDYAYATIDLTTTAKEVLEFQSNMSLQKVKMKLETFDTILVDAPCSGSGTWKRSPEQMVGFTDEKLSDYSKRQKKIVLNALPYLKKGGKLIYMTCSIYHAENEAVIADINHEKKLELLSSQYYNCSDKGGDSIYKAELVGK